MEFIAIFLTAGTVGAFLYGAFLGVLMLTERYRQQKKEIADLRRDNLSYARTNTALRELLSCSKPVE